MLDHVTIRANVRHPACSIPLAVGRVCLRRVGDGMMIDPRTGSFTVDEWARLRAEIQRECEDTLRAFERFEGPRLSVTQVDHETVEIEVEPRWAPVHLRVFRLRWEGIDHALNFEAVTGYALLELYRSLYAPEAGR